MAPIRTVLFTQLCKYDGRRVRVLSVREFQQIAGRAGRRGFDTAGSVVVQAPEHVVENKKAEAKAATDPKKKKKLVKRKPPERGYAHWDGDTLARLSEGRTETLHSSFTVSHAMMLNVLDRPGDGCAAMRNLLVDNHETRKNQRSHIRRSIAVYRSLIEAEVLEALDEPDEKGRPVRINLDLQDDFRLNQPLSLFALEAIDALDRAAPHFAWQLLSVIESVLDNPMVVLLAQLDKAKETLISELKRDGVEYEQRMEQLEQVTWPKPEADFLEPAFEVFARHHPWVGRDRVQPKSVVRDMLEHAETFNQYIARYGLKRSEGAVLRYLTDCYKAMVQTVPVDVESEEFDDLTEWLRSHRSPPTSGRSRCSCPTKSSASSPSSPTIARENSPTTWRRTGPNTTTSTSMPTLGRRSGARSISTPALPPRRCVTRPGSTNGCSMPRSTSPPPMKRSERS